MRRFTPTHVLLVVLTAPFIFGWTSEGRPVGDTTTVTRGDVIYADEGSTIRVYRSIDDGFELVQSIETDPEATHEDDYEYRKKRRKKHSFSCSCSHSHDHGRHGYDYHEHYAKFVVLEFELYYVHGSSVVVTLDITTPDEPYEVSRVDVGWEIETIEVIADVVVVSGGDNTFTFE